MQTAFWVEELHDREWQGYGIKKQMDNDGTVYSIGIRQRDADKAWNWARINATAYAKQFGGELVYTTLPNWATPSDDLTGPRACWLVKE